MARKHVLAIVFEAALWFLRNNLHPGDGVTMIKPQLNKQDRKEISSIIDRIRDVDQRIMATLSEMESARDLIGGIQNNTLYDCLSRDLNALRVIMHDNVIDIVEAVSLESD